MVANAPLRSLLFLLSQAILECWYVNVSASRHYSFSLCQIFCFCGRCHSCTMLLLHLDKFIIYCSHPMLHLNIIHVSHSLIASMLYSFIFLCILFISCSYVGPSLYWCTSYTADWLFLLKYHVYLSDSSLFIYQPSGLEPPRSPFLLDMYQIPGLLARVLCDDRYK